MNYISATVYGHELYRVEHANILLQAWERRKVELLNDAKVVLSQKFEQIKLKQNRKNRNTINNIFDE